MTVTSAHAGITATRLRRAILATVAAVLLIMTGVAAGPASAATPTPTPTLSGEVTATLAPLNNGVVAGGEALSAAVTVSNGTTAPVDAASATLNLADAPLTGRAALQEWLRGEGGIPAGAAAAITAVPEVPSAGSVTASFLVPAADATLAGRAAGVYAAWVTVGPLAARSVIVVPAPTTAAVGIVVPITAGALRSGLLSAAALESLTASDGDLTVQLDAVAGTPAILAVDPAIPAAIRALGTTAPPSAVEWLDRLEQLPNSRFALQFGDADVSTQLAAGLATPWQPTSLVSYLSEDGFPAQRTATPTPAPDGTPATTVPDLAALLDVGAASAAAYWPPTGTTSPAIVGALAAGSPDALTLVASTSTAAGAAGETVAARGSTPESANVLVYDGVISLALRDAAIEPEGADRAAALAAASAHLAFATTEAAGSPLLVVVDRGQEHTRLGLRGAIAAATGIAGTTPLDLPTIAAAPANAVTLVAEPADAERAASIGSLQADADSIARFATVLDDPALLTGAERAEALQLLGAAWLSDRVEWQAAMTAHAAHTTGILSSVSIVQPTSINLLTAGTDLKFWIHNDLPYPANVVLHAIPDDLRLTIDRETTVTVSAADASGSSNTPVVIPVRARIANGEASISLSLRSPTMEPIGTDQVVDVNVRADWENVGLAVLVVLVGGFFTIGVVRTIRRRRRVKNAPDAEGTEVDA
jgi:hypothetical protein